MPGYCVVDCCNPQQDHSHLNINNLTTNSLTPYFVPSDSFQRQTNAPYNVRTMKFRLIQRQLCIFFLILFADIKKVCNFAPLKPHGPFVYRLGRKIFILERAVRFCYGLQNKKIINNKWLTINQQKSAFARPSVVAFTIVTIQNRPAHRCVIFAK